MSSSCHIETGTDACARISGALTFESAAGLYRETEKLFQGRAPVTSIDLSRVTDADSAGLALLLEWQARQRPASRSLHIINSPASLMSLARLCEADQLLNMSGRKEQT
jgi:phospholipid transport system transporter-binding protein